jgi:hypothetical protein
MFSKTSVHLMLKKLTIITRQSTLQEVFKKLCGFKKLSIEPVTYTETFKVSCVGDGLLLEHVKSWANGLLNPKQEGDPVVFLTDHKEESAPLLVAA